MKRLLLLAALAAVVVPSPGRAADDWCRESGDTPVVLYTSDGRDLAALEVGTGSTGIVLGHQVLSDHCELIDLARELARKGYRALSLDFRGNGGRLDLDVAAAVAQLRADGATRIKLVGVSMGGTAMLAAAASVQPAVDGVASLSGPASFDVLDALKAVRRSKVPVRFLVAKLDRYAPDAQRLMRAAAARDKAIVRYPGALHGSSLLAIPKAKAYLLAFLAR